MHLKAIAAAVLVIGALLGGPVAQAGAIHDAVLFNDSSLPANDDGSTGLVGIGFNVNYFGTTYSNLYVNNNGNVTFTGPLSTFTPFGLLTSSIPIIAPFFADVDTRAGNIVRFGQDTLGGRAAFGVNWIDVGYYSVNTDKLNSFQLILIDRSDVAPGDFDIEFNYDKIQWETGDASSGSGGLGGSSARVGWTNGGISDFELAGSGINGAFLDGGLNALISHSLNSNTLGQYIFNVRNGTIVTVPEPGTFALMVLALLGIGFARRRIN